MAVFETWLKSDLKKPVNVRHLGGHVFSQDNGGNLIGVEVTDNGQPAELSGGVTGLVIRADNATVAIQGSIEGNKASVILPQAAYAVVGPVSIAIKVGETTVGACVGYVYRTSTDEVVDPGTIIPSVEALIDAIAEAVESIPPDYSALSEQVDELEETTDDLEQDIYLTKGKVEELEDLVGSGMSTTAINLLETILNEALYGTDQSNNIVLLTKELRKTKPVSISATFTGDALVGTKYHDLDFVVTAVFDDDSTEVLDSYTVLTDGRVVTGSNTVTIRARRLETTVTFQSSNVVTYSVSYDLTDVESSNTEYVVIENSRYETTLSVEDEDHYISSVEVTMGGVDITSTAYINGVITIAEVTGDIEITAVGMEYAYIDSLIPVVNYCSNVYAYSAGYEDHYVTPEGFVIRINSNGRVAVSEYPALSDCTLHWSIKNISENNVTMTNVGIGSINAYADDYFVNATAGRINVGYFVSANPQSGTLAPGASIEGTVNIKAGWQIAMTGIYTDFASLEVKLRGNYVPDTFAGYSEILIQNSTETYGSYRNIKFYSDNGETEIANKSSNAFKLLANNIETGTYDVFYEVKYLGGVPTNNVINNPLLIGAVETNTQTTCNYAGGKGVSSNNAMWHHTQFTVPESGLNLIGWIQYPGEFNDTDPKFVIKLKKVVTQ